MDLSDFVGETSLTHGIMQRVDTDAYMPLEEAYDDLIVSRACIHNTVRLCEETEETEELDTTALDAVKIVKSYETRAAQLKNMDAESEWLQKKLNEFRELENAVHDNVRALNTVLDTPYILDAETAQAHFETYLAWKKSLEKAMSAYKSHHIESLDNIKKKRTTLEAGNVAVRNMLVTGAKLIIPEDNEKVHMCPVCFDKEVDTVLTPCGHTLCRACLPNITKCMTCMTCRAKIAKHYSLYFSV